MSTSSPLHDSGPGFSQLSEDALIQLMRNNPDSEIASRAWGVLFDRYHRYVEQVIFRSYGDFLPEDIIHDICSDTFLKMRTHGAYTYDVSKSSGTKSPAIRFKNWIGVVALNATRDVLRKPKERELPPSLACNIVDEPPQELTAVQQSLLEKVKSLLNPNEWAVLVVTFAFYDPHKGQQRIPSKEVRSIASALGISPDNLRQIKMRAIKKIRKFLVDNNNGDQSA